MSYSVELYMGGKYYSVIDPKILREQIGKLGLDMSHLPGNPNEIIYYLGTRPADIYVLLTQADLEEILANESEDAFEINTSAGELRIRYNDESVTFYGLTYVTSWSIAGNYTTPNPNQVHLVHLQDTRRFLHNHVVNFRFNNPYASTGTNDVDFLKNINASPSPDVRWTWKEILEKIPLEFSPTTSLLLIANTWDMTYDSYPTEAPLDVIFQGNTMAQVTDSLLGNIGAVLHRSYNNNYTLKAPSYVNGDLTLELDAKRTNYIDGGNTFKGYQRIDLLRFLFPKFDMSATDEDPIYEKVHDFNLTQSQNVNEIALEGPLVALMNGTTTPVNLSAINDYVSDVANSIRTLYEDVGNDDLVFSGLIKSEIDCRYNSIHIYDHGYGLFTRLKSRHVLPPENPLAGRRFLGASGASGGSTNYAIRFSADSAFTKSTASFSATVSDTSSALDGNTITVYNCLTSVASTHIFKGDSGDFGLAIKRGDGNYWCIMMECP